MEVLLTLVGLVIVVAPFAAIGLVLSQRRRLADLEREVRKLRAPLDADSDGMQASAAVHVPVPASDRAAAEPRVPLAEVSSLPASPVAASDVEAETLAASAPAAAAPCVVPAPDTRPSPSLESFLGGRVLLVVGVIAVLFAVAFFLKVAFDRGWVPPLARVAACAVAGLVALRVGDRLRARGYVAYGHALMGGGLGALFMATFFAAARYDLIPRPLGFGVTAVITALGAALAIRRDAPLLAWLGFLGAFLAPALLGRHEDTIEALSGWLILLDLGLLAVLSRRSWQGFEILAGLVSAVHFAHWLNRWLNDERIVAGSLCLGALTVAMLLLCYAPACLARRTFHPIAHMVALLTSVLAFVAAHELLAAQHRTALGLSLVGLGVLHAMAARIAMVRVPAGQRPQHDGEFLAGYALASVATAIPFLLEGSAITPAWAFGGAAAVFVGARRWLPLFGGMGSVMIALAAGKVVSEQIPLHGAAFTLVFNGAFLSAMAPCVAAGVGGWIIARSRPAWTLAEWTARLAGAWGAGLLLAHEVWLWFVLEAPGDEALASRAGYAVAAAVVALFASGLAGVARRRGAGADAASVGVAFMALVVLVSALAGGALDGWVPFWNARLLGGVITVVGVAAVVVRTSGPAGMALGMAGLAALLALLSVELFDRGELAGLDGATREDLRFGAQVWISVTWAVTGALLVGLGFRVNRSGLRWAGLAALLLTVGKVFLFDLSQLDTVSRIGSFLALGLLLVGASFLYQRMRDPDGEA